MPATVRLPFLAAGTAVRVVNADTGWVVARSARVVDDSLLWGQTLVELHDDFASTLGRVAVDRSWVQVLS